MATAVQDQTLQLSSLPPKRPRRAILAIVAGIVGALLVGGLSIAALREDENTVRSEPLATPGTTTVANAPPTTTAGATTPTAGVTATGSQQPANSSQTTVPPATAAPDRLTPDSRLRLDGLGPVRVGMTLDEASRAAGVAIRVRPGESGGTDCTYAYAAGFEDAGFMVVGGRIVRIDAGFREPARVKTLSGIGKGSSEADVMKAYAGQIRVEPHKYVPGGKDLVYVPNDAAYRQYSMIFEVIDGRVGSFRSGFTEQVSWIEGCS